MSESSVPHGSYKQERFNFPPIQTFGEKHWQAKLTNIFQGITRVSVLIVPEKTRESNWINYGFDIRHTTE
jgi:hypothetical protein